MNNKLRRIAFAIAPLIIFSFSAGARATSTDVVLNLEGNPTCSSLGDNSAVLEVRDGNPGGTRTITMPTPDGSQTIEYTAIFGGGNTNAVVDEWSIESVTDSSGTYLKGTSEFNARVYPMNYVILKAQNGSKGGRVFYFGSAMDGDGAVSDADEEVPGPGLNSVSFCYGLTRSISVQEPPISISDLPSCDDLNGDGVPTDFFTTGIDCPAPFIDPVTGRPNEQLIINMALNDPQFGFDFDNNSAVRACTCNSNLKPCNPDLAAQRVNSLGQYVDASGSLVDENGNPTTIPVTADDLSSDQRTCLEYNPDSTNDRGTPDGVNDRVPFVIMGVENPDSYICYDIGGTRYCYGHY